MKSKSIARGAVLSIVLVAAGTSLWWKLRPDASNPAVVHIPADEPTGPDDSTVDGATAEGQQIENLLRASAADPKTLALAKDFAASESPTKRMAGMTVLTRFSDQDSLETLKAHFSSLSQTQQAQIIQKLRAALTPARKEWLATVDGPTAAVTKIYDARDETELSVGLKELKSLSLDGQMAAVSSMSEKDLQAPQKKWLMSQAFEAREPRLRIVAINKLAELKVPEFSSSLSKLSRDPEKSIRIAAIEAVTLLCPKDRWTLIQERAEHENDPLVLRRLLDSLSYLRGTKAQQSVETIKKRSSSLPKELLNKIVETDADLKQSNVANRCDKT